MDYIKDNILRKYLNGEIDTDIEKNSILNLDKELIKVCEGKTLLVKGEMTLIVGGKNSGKSKFMNYLLKQLLIDDSDSGFQLKTKEDIKVIHFDSEMSENRLANWSINALYNQYGKEYIEEILSDKLFIYTLKKETITERVSCIHSIYKQLQSDFVKTQFIICVDVGTCLTSDLNNQNSQGVIDDLVRKLDQCTLIVTIHDSLKLEEKKGISMGAIGTALEKLCAIKLVINQTDSLKRHKVEFHNSKYEDVNKEKDYFFIHTEKDNEEKISITGISDSDGIISIKKSYLKTDLIEFKSYLFELINNSTSDSERLRKNIVPKMMIKFNYRKTSVFDKIKFLIKEGVIKEIDGELLIN